LAARATAALADAYVARRDRVGLISFGGILRWLAPDLGTTQLYRLVDALLDTEIVLSYYWKEIDVIPRPSSGLDAVAYDIWALRRDALRQSLQRAGIAVAEWHEGVPFQSVLEEVRAFRRFARHA